MRTIDKVYEQLKILREQGVLISGLDFSISVSVDRGSKEVISFLPYDFKQFTIEFKQSYSTIGDDDTLFVSVITKEIEGVSREKVLSEAQKTMNELLEKYLSAQIGNAPVHILNQEVEQK